MTFLAVLAVALLWRARPGAATAAAVPQRDIVLGCEWLMWLLAGYLALAIGATALGHLLGSSRPGAEAVAQLAPAGLRRLVDAAVTMGVTAAIFTGATTIPAGAAGTSHLAGAPAPRPAASGGALDWPGRSDPIRPKVRHERGSGSPSATPPGTSTDGPSPRPHRTRRHHRADVGLVTSGSSATTRTPSHGDPNVVVQRGDTLWAIAERRLGPQATDAAITSAWHAWYTANRDVVGGDPDLIYPGQRLRPPSARQTSGARPGSTR